MSTGVNKHGLSRSIPADVACEVRRRCGFGCVVCGAALYDYEHFDPEFKDAKEHRAEGIALLCPNHHRAKSAGTLTDAAYRAAIDNPVALERGWSDLVISKEAFSPQFAIGPATFNLGASIFEVDNEMLLGFKAPEEPGTPPRLLMKLRDELDQVVFEIEDNEVRVNARAFDVHSTGRRWTVRSQDDYVADISFELPYRIRLARLKLVCREWELAADATSLQVLRSANAVWRLTGPVFISGVCLARCDSGLGRVLLSGLTFEGARQSPVPADSRSMLLPKGGVLFRLPLSFFVTGTRETPISECRLGGIIGLPGVLPVFSSRDLAEKAVVPDDYRIESLGSGGFTKMLRDLAVPQGFRSLCIDPDPTAEQQVLNTYDISSAIESLETIGDAEIEAKLAEMTERPEGE